MFGLVEKDIFLSNTTISRHKLHDSYLYFK